MMKSLKDSTLMGMTKKKLIELIRCLEHNLSVFEERNDNQFRLLTMNWLKQELYKWHNVENELPPVGHRVDTRDNCGCSYYNWREECNGVICWKFGENSCNRIVAWREIEPYEEE